MKLAYADPPYFGCCRLYGHHHPDGRCWDDLDTHRALIDRLVSEFPERPAYAWEPVIFWRGRNPGAGHAHPPPPKGGKQTTPKDFIVEPITLKRGLTGAKPERVCSWILDLLGATGGDVVADLFPGTGAMGRAATRVGAWSSEREAAQ